MKRSVVFAAFLVCGVIGEEELLRNVIPRSPFQNKIVGGSPINIEEWNSIVSLNRGLDFFSHACSGNILTASVIVSAANCVETMGIDWSRPEYWRVRAASNYHASGGVYHQLRRIVKHPNWNPGTAHCDISMLALATPLVLSPSIGQAVIPPQDGTIADGSLARVAGWGATVEGGGFSPILMAATVQIISQKSCQDAYGGITASMICAGWPTGGRDACSGDSGGPLLANGVVHGIVSWGRGCARPDSPGVFTRVAYLTNWIVQTANSI